VPQSTFPTAAVGGFASPAPPRSPGTATSVRVVSAGYEDGNAADFYFDGRSFEITGASERRGLNVVIVDPSTEKVLSGKSYDIWGNPAAENLRLAADLRGLPEGQIVLVALKDSGLENIDNPALYALQGVGATIARPLGMREGYALIGIKGGRALAENQGPRVELEATLPCSVEAATGAPPRPPAAAPFPAAQPFAQSPPPAVQPFAQTPPQPQGGLGGGVSLNELEAEREAGSNGQGQSWEEVVLLLDQLQEQIRARRQAGESPVPAR